MEENWRDRQMDKVLLKQGQRIEAQLMASLPNRRNATLTKTLRSL